MSKSVVKDPPTPPRYESDFYAWTQAQARAIEERRWAEVDLPNVAEELRTLGREIEREVEERVEILLSYLVKWRHLAEYRGKAWKEIIDRQRDEIEELFRENPTLTYEAQRIVADAYADARRRLRYETYFFTSDFPASCPFTAEQVLDATFYPEELDAPATDRFPTASTVA